jgi:hypothetical protein
MLTKYLLLVLSFFILNSNLHAQRPSERFITSNPLADTSALMPDSKTRPMQNFGGWAGFGRYLGDEHDHGWYQELGGFAELVRFNNKNTLVFTAQIEFIADLHNEINFNPRAIFWEEGLYFMSKTESGRYWKLGYYHRCKHDIDNLNLGEQRALIFGSLYASTIFPIEIAEDQKLQLVFSADIYTITYDSRISVRHFEQGTAWDQLSSSFRVNARYSRKLSENTGLFASGYGMLSTLSPNSGLFDRFNAVEEVYLQAGISAGFLLKGRANMQIGFKYEYLEDSGIPIMPEASHLFSFGIIAYNPLNVFP